MCNLLDIFHVQASRHLLERVNLVDIFLSELQSEGNPSTINIAIPSPQEVVPTSLVLIPPRGGTLSAHARSRPGLALVDRILL